MTDHEKLVMRNIIYAVETGGQVYEKLEKYADFTEGGLHKQLLRACNYHWRRTVVWK